MQNTKNISVTSTKNPISELQRLIDASISQVKNEMEQDKIYKHQYRASLISEAQNEITELFQSIESQVQSILADKGLDAFDVRIVRDCFGKTSCLVDVNLIKLTNKTSGLGKVTLSSIK